MSVEITAPSLSVRAFIATTEEELFQAVSFVRHLRMVRKAGGYGKVTYIIQNGLVVRCDTQVSEMVAP
jgi:hypothetical protein